MKTLQSELIEKGFSAIQKNGMDNRIAKKNNEKLSRKDLEDLMGIRRDVFTRGKGGAIRKK